MSVGELARRIQRLLEEGVGRVSVEGEISNLRVPASGHAYFALKDDEATLNAVCFRSALERIKVKLRDGLKIEARGRVTAYVARSEYQIVVESAREAGLGDLMRRFIELRDRLKAEGVFDAARKKSLPRLPRAVGIATSATGAALRDVLHVLRRRAPGIWIYVAPCAVQGASAAGEIVRALELLQRHGKSEVVIVGRGGGSIEDLWAFNEEPVARAIAACRIPIVSAVGHETDTTLADFAADVRAPTPSAAAEIVTQGYEDLIESLRDLHRAIDRLAERALRERRASLGALTGAWGFRRPVDRLAAAVQRVDELNDRLTQWARTRRERADARLIELDRRLDRVGPMRRVQDAVARMATLRGRLDGARPDRRWLPVIERRLESRRQLSLRLNQAARRSLGEARLRREALDRRLEGSGPQRVLERGFSIITTAAGRRIITSPEQLRMGQALRVQSAGGEWRATPLPPGDELFDRING